MWCLRFPFYQISFNFIMLIRNCSVHSWHFLKLHQFRLSNASRLSPWGHLRVFTGNFWEKFKCHSCDGTISTKILSFILSIVKTLHCNSNPVFSCVWHRVDGKRAWQEGSQNFLNFTKLTLVFSGSLYSSLNEDPLLLGHPVELSTMEPTLAQVGCMYKSIIFTPVIKGSIKKGWHKDFPKAIEPQRFFVTFLTHHIIES